MNESTIPGYSTNGLLMMHQGIRNALETDDNLPTKQEKIYCVREFSDWRTWGDAIEAELDSRNVKYRRIVW